MPHSSTLAQPSPAVRISGARSLLTIGLALVLGTLAWAAESKQNFDVVAGDAAVALKQIAKQAGQQIVFPAQEVKGVKTPAIKGEYSLKEALALLLAKTGLEAAFDQTSGTIAVSRAALPNAQRAAPSLTSDRPANRPSPETDAVVELSPFVVDVAAEKGYQATHTLAGTRLNTSVKDLGASISIYTKDLIDDLGVTNANELLIYATGMEASGPQGNYSGVASDINVAQFTGDSIRGTPQRARTRGLASPTYTRGFFITSIPVDSFNTGAVTNIRGPNAILFGTGSAAGVVDTSLIAADLRRNSNRVEFRYGNNSSARSSVDFNRVLIPGRLALRVAGLKDGEENNQRPSFEHKERIYGALTAKPFRSTTLRASFEAGGTSANRPLSILPFNSISPQWYAAGRPVYDWSFYDDPARNPAAAAQNAGNFMPLYMGTGQFFDQIAFIYSQPNAKGPNISFRGTLANTTATVADAVRNSLFHPLVNRDSAIDTIRVFTTLNIAEQPSPVFAGGQIPANLKFQGFTDFSTFDYKNRMLDETSRQMDAFHTFNVALEQMIWKDRAGLEIAYNRERYDVRSRNSFIQSSNNNHIRIDTSVMLPNGQPNPNVGRPFVQYGGGNWNDSFTEREAVRATAFVRYDFKELSPTLGRWLGRHVATGLREITQTDTLPYLVRLATDGDAAESITPDASAFSRRPGLFVYIGDSILNGKPLQFQPVQVPLVRAGLSAPTSYFKAATGSPAQGDFATVTTTLQGIVQDSPATRAINKNKAAVLQSYWLQENLVTTVGWRRDAEYRYTQSIGFAKNPTKSTYGFADYVLPELPPELVALETLSYSAVLRWPQKLVRLPAGTEFSVFANNSENFAPSGGRVGVYNQQLPQQQGTTREYGFNLSVFHDRLFIRVNRFETKTTDQSLGTPASFAAAYNNGVLQTATFWAQERNINPAIDRSADIETLFSTLPADFRAIHQFRVTGSAAQQNLSATYQLPAGISDTTDYTAKGTEIELTFSPNRQWRFLFNVANQETVQTNIAPGTKEFITRMMPAWEKLYDKPRVNYPGGFVLGSPVPASTQTIRQFLNSAGGPLVSFATLVATEGVVAAEQRKWRANLVANYTFARDSRLKGWNMGTGVRWQDKIGIGYRADRDAAGIVKLDIKNPFYAPAETNIDAFLGYTRKIWSDRIEWKAQLNVRNLIGQTKPIAITVQPWGETASVRLAPERRWYLTNTFSF